MAGMMGVTKTQIRSTYVLMSCPFASKLHQKAEDKHPSLSVVLGLRSYWRCFACGQRGILYGLAYQWASLFGKDPAPILDLIDFEENSVTVRCQILDQKFDAKWKKDGESMADRIDFEVFDEMELGPFTGRVPQYILDRGIALATCKEWQIGSDPDWRDPETKQIWPRVVFPVRRMDQKLVGIVGRTIDDDGPNRYYNYWHFTKTNHLYGIDKVKDRDFVMVVEGMVDVLKLWEYSLPVVGTMGAMPSDRQAQLLQEFGKVLLALDRDKAGKEGVEWLIPRLKDRVQLYTVTFPDGKTDPKQMTMEESWEAVDKAKRVL